MPRLLPRPVSVALAGDAVLCAGLRMAFQDRDGIHVTAVATPDELAAGDGPIDVVMMPDPADASLLARRIDALRVAHPDVPIVVLVNAPQPARALAAIDLGASGVMVLDASPEELVHAASAAAAGGMPIDPRLTRYVIDHVTESSRPADALTAREAEVVERVWRGLSNKQIGRDLGITEPTVKVHLTRVYQRLGVSSRTEAAMWFDARRRAADDTIAS